MSDPGIDFGVEQASFGTGLPRTNETNFNPREPLCWKVCCRRFPKAPGTPNHFSHYCPRMAVRDLAPSLGHRHRFFHFRSLYGSAPTKRELSRLISPSLAGSPEPSAVTMYGSVRHAQVGSWIQEQRSII